MGTEYNRELVSPAIIRCISCGARNRIDEHDTRLTPVCGRCRKPLPYSNSQNDSTVTSNCVICHHSCHIGRGLSNGTVYHQDCYQKLCSEISDFEHELTKYTRQIQVLERQFLRGQSVFSKFWDFILSRRIDLEESLCTTRRYQCELRELLQKQYETLDKLHTFWLTYPPDWEERRQHAFSKSCACVECGSTHKLLHIHHKIPISNGGSHSTTNLVVLCESCHRKAHGGREFSYSDPASVGTYGKRIELLQKAISEEATVHFSYRKYDGERSTRSFQPEGFKQMGKSLCVYGYCHLRCEDRTFAVKRMSSVKVISDIEVLRKQG